MKHVTVMRSYEDRESDTYLIAWQSENGKYITSYDRITVTCFNPVCLITELSFNLS